MRSIGGLRRSLGRSGRRDFRIRRRSVQWIDKAVDFPDALLLYENKLTRFLNYLILNLPACLCGEDQLFVIRILQREFRFTILPRSGSGIGNPAGLAAFGNDPLPKSGSFHACRPAAVKKKSMICA